MAPIVARLYAPTRLHSSQWLGPAVRTKVFLLSFSILINFTVSVPRRLVLLEGTRIYHSTPHVRSQIKEHFPSLLEDHIEGILRYPILGSCLALTDISTSACQTSDFRVRHCFSRSVVSLFWYCSLHLNLESTCRHQCTTVDLSVQSLPNPSRPIPHAKPIP